MDRALLQARSLGEGEKGTEVAVRNEQDSIQMHKRSIRIVTVNWV